MNGFNISNFTGYFIFILFIYLFLVLNPTMGNGSLIWLEKSDSDGNLRSIKRFLIKVIGTENVCYFFFFLFIN
jgi:hypothetical protein